MLNRCFKKCLNFLSPPDFPERGHVDAIPKESRRCGRECESCCPGGIQLQGGRLQGGQDQGGLCCVKILVILMMLMFQGSQDQDGHIDDCDDQARYRWLHW